MFFWGFYYLFFFKSSYKNAFSQESCKLLKLNDPQVVFTLAFVKSTGGMGSWFEINFKKKTNYGKTVKKSHQKSFSKKDWNMCVCASYYRFNFVHFIIPIVYIWALTEDQVLKVEDTKLSNAFIHDITLKPSW